MQSIAAVTTQMLRAGNSHILEYIAYSFTTHSLATVLLNCILTHICTQVRETEQLLITLWDATFAPPIDLPGFIYHKGIAARKKLMPIIQVARHAHIHLSKNL
jgi:hypothetical protein